MSDLMKVGIPTAVTGAAGWFFGGPAGAAIASKLTFLFAAKTVAVEKLGRAADSIVGGVDDAKKIMLQGLAKTVNVSGNALTAAYISSYLPATAFQFGLGIQKIVKKVGTTLYIAMQPLLELLPLSAYQ